MKDVVVPEGWSVATVMDIATASGGGTPSKSDPSYWTDGSIPWVSPKDMKVFMVDDTEDTVTTKALDRLTLIPKDSVLVVVRSGILARTLPVAINKSPATINQDMRAFVPANGVNSRFLAWQLIAKEREILEACSKDGTTVASIEGPALAAYPLMVAPSNEQTRIVEKLEELLSDLDAGVAELKAAQRKLVQYRQSLLKAAVEGALTADWRAARANSGDPLESDTDLLQRILTERRARWEAKQLAKYAEQGKTPPKGWQAKYPAPIVPDASELPALPKGWIWASLEQLAEIQGGIQKQPSRAPKSNHYPFLRVANVSRGQLKLDEIHEIELFKGELERFALLKGDVLIVEGNGSSTEIGRCAVWDGSIENAVHQNHLIRARPLLVSGEFVEAWLNSSHGIEYMASLAATTSGLYTLSVGKISKIPVPVPPQSEQQEILAILKEATDSFARQEASIEFALKQATAQRKNILDAAFAGQLVPQDANDEPASALLARIRSVKATQAKPKRSNSMNKRPRPTSAHIDQVRNWINDRNQFTFDELRAGIPAPYQALRDALFTLLTERSPLIDQAFSSEAGVLLFRRIRQ